MNSTYTPPKICGIYRIWHRETGRTYIGQSIDIVSRWGEHLSRGMVSAHPHNFCFEIVEQCARSRLKEKEGYWIKHYDCIHPNGFNKNQAPKVALIDELVNVMSDAGSSKKDVLQAKKMHLKNIWQRVCKEKSEACKDSD